MQNQVQLVSPSPLAANFSKIFTPAAVLLAVILLAGAKSDMGIVATLILALGVVAVPGFVYKKFPTLAKMLGLPTAWRTALVTALTLSSALICVLVDVPAPVPATVVGLVAGNAGLALVRRRMNASAHVSVLTFAALWATQVFGPSFAWLLVLSPMMLFSRTALREHSWGEALIGAVIGLVTFGCFAGANNWSLIT